MTMAQHPLDQLLSEVEGNPWSNFQKEVTNQQIGDWIVNSSQTFVPYHKNLLVKDDRSHLQNILNRLNSTYIYLNAVHKHKGYLCDISLNRSEIMRNYIRECRRRTDSRKGNNQPIFLTLNLKGTTSYSDFVMKVLQVVDISKEGLLKQLPYKLQHLLLTLSFTWKVPPLNFNGHTFEISVSDGCLTSSVHQRQGQTDEQEYENVTKVESVKGRIPSAKADLNNMINHLLMYAIHMQDLLFHMFDDSQMSFNREICNIDYEYKSMHSLNFHRMTECCSIQKAYPKLYKWYQVSSDTGWFCHDPYYVTRLLGMMPIAISYLSIALCPLMIKWIIPHSFTAKTSKKR